jgi:hypothetical protein
VCEWRQRRKQLLRQRRERALAVARAHRLAAAAVAPRTQRSNALGVAPGIENGEVELELRETRCVQIAERRLARQQQRAVDGSVHRRVDALSRKGECGHRRLAPRKASD